MSSHSVSHDGLDRVVDGFQAARSIVPRLYQAGPLRLFAIVTFSVAAATAVTGLWVRSIDGADTDDWVGARLLFVLLVMGLSFVLNALSGRMSLRLADWRAARRAARDDERLMQLSKWDYRMADEIRVLRSRD